MYQIRTRNPRHSTKTYYLALEGISTEYRYFVTLISSGIFSRNVHPIILMKSANEVSYSNPRKLIDLVCDYMHFQKTGEYPTDLFIGHVLDYLNRKQMKMNNHDLKVYSEDLKSTLLKMGVSKDELISDYNLAIIISEEYFKRVSNRDIIVDLSDYKQPFYEGMDCDYSIIVDRDEHSFRPNQVAEVDEICQLKKIRFVLTNPCFELWLMLHFDISKDTIMKCVQMNEMKKELSKYSKINEERIDSSEYAPFVGKARRKLNDYTQDLNILKRPTSDGPETIGSNIGYLIDELTDRRYL